MLNDIKDWASEKVDQSKETAQSLAYEVENKDVMDWSGGVWFVIGIIVILALIGMNRER